MASRLGEACVAMDRGDRFLCYGQVIGLKEARAHLRGLALVREHWDNEYDASEGTDWDDGDATRGGVGCGGAPMAKVRPRSSRGVAAVSSGLCRSKLGAERVFSCAELPP